MKKLINKPDDVVTEALHGIAAAHPHLVSVHFDPNFIVRADAPVQGMFRRAVFDVQISGLQAGYDCVLRVTDKDGKVYTAGSWKVSQKAARDGSKFGGGVLIPIDRVKSVDLLTLQGRRLISTPI